jgi:site-specific DNA-cytosine methylase
MKILSLFDWMACGYEALVRAWIPIDKYYASEIDKYAIQIAMKNHPDIIQIWDVTRVNWADYKWIDLLIWGSPCQWFSVAWKQLAFDDPRSKLFFEYVRILKESQPKYFLLENVKMRKERVDIISWYLGVQPIEIDSSLVSAQRRKRLYRTNIPNITQPEDKWLVIKDILEDNVDEKYFYSKDRWERILNWKYDIVKRLEDKDNKCATLTTVWGGNHEKKIRVSHCPASREFDWYWWKEKCPTLCARDYKDPKVVKIEGGVHCI